MITTTHARPSFQVAFNLQPLNKLVVCPRCAQILGPAHGAHQMRDVLGSHRCMSAKRELLQPSTAMPFS